MKTLLTIILALLIAPMTIAQKADFWCGYEATPEQHALSIKAAKESRTWQGAAKSGATTYIPIKFHSVGDDDGTKHRSLRTILNILCELNDHFSGTDFHFYLWGNIDYINSTSANSGNVNNWFYSQNNVDDVVNVYIAESAGPGLCGYFTWGGDAVMMKADCAGAGDATFPHEMGHYFYLAHTFNDFDAGDLFNSEYVTRSFGLRNCEDKGDGYCDTDADYLPNRWNCLGATHTQKDWRGDTYNPDETLYMSYSSDHCINRFSNEQINGMNYVVNAFRSELKSHPTPSNGSLASTTLTQPAMNELDVPKNYVTFTWDPVPGATAYHLICTRYNINSDYKLAVDVLVEGTNTYTAINADFEEYKFYDWIVKPINEANTCEAYTAKGSFQTGESITISGIEHATEKATFQVVPNIIEGSQISFYLDTDLNTSGNVVIYNVNGQQVANRVIDITSNARR
jgi:hypothetical protein